MAFTFCGNGAWGTGIGAPLSIPQIDGNFWLAEQRLAALEADSTPNGIASATSDGANIIFTLDDSTQLDPIPIPLVGYNWRGEWQPVTFYALRDVFYINGSLYQVLLAHTSDLTFDPFASESTSDLYGLLLENPGNTIATGGTVGQFYRKQSTTDFDGGWDDANLDDLSDVAIATDLADGDHLVYRGGFWGNEADISGTVSDSQLLQIKVQAVSSSSGVLTINRLNGEICKVALTENITSIVVNNWPSANIFGRIVLDFTNPASWTVVGYPVNKWAGSLGAPVVTVASTDADGQDRIMMSTTNAGTTVLGDVIAQNYG